MVKTEASSRMRVSIQPRRWSKFCPVAVSCPHKKARRTQWLTMWHHGVSVSETRDERGRVMVKTMAWGLLTRVSFFYLGILVSFVAGHAWIRRVAGQVNSSTFIPAIAASGMPTTSITIGS